MSRQPSLAALVRQNAHASRYLGVDFVPVYRSSRHPVEFIGDESAPLAPQATAAAVPAHPAGSFVAAEEHAMPTSPKPAATPKPPSRFAPSGSKARSADKPTPASAPAAPFLPPARPAGAPAQSRPSIAFVPQPPLPEWNDAQVANFDLLEAIRKRYEQDAPHENFVTDHHSIVFGDGDPCAKLVFVGEAPGAEEDKVGKPFVGRAGELLNKMIVAMGLSRASVYITNVLKTRPPNNATPTLDEARLCAPYLFDQIAVIQPAVIVTLGLPATRLLLGTDQTMGALRGKWASFSHGSITVPVMPTYHPAYLLRAYTTENREKVWSDLQKAMELLGQRPAKN